MHKKIITPLGLAALGICMSIAGWMINSPSTHAQVPQILVNNFNNLGGDFLGRNTRQTDLHRNYGGNDFQGLIFRGNHKVLDTAATVNINSTEKICEKQVRGLYYNPARGQVLRPLDQASLEALQAIDASYNGLQLSGGLYIGCDADTTHVFGQVTHTIGSLEHKIIAGVDVLTATNSYNHSFADSTIFDQSIASGYIVDSVGGLANIDGIAPAYEVTIPTPTQDNTTIVGTNTTIVGTGTPGDIVTITIDGQTYTGTIDYQGFFEIFIVVPIGENNVNISITDPNTGDEVSTKTLTIIAEEEEQPSQPSGPRRGSPGPRLITDEQAGICDIRDCSDSYYDSECGVCDEEQETITEQDLLINDPTAFTQQVLTTSQNMNCDISQELAESYIFSFDIGITTVPDICQADMYGGLIRKHMAKFMVMFATQVLGKFPDTSVTCDFQDMDNETIEFRGFARLACQLGMMGLKQDGTPNNIFNPTENVTRSQFGTALSRLLYGSTHNTSTDIWYQAHLNALQADGIMTMIENPDILEIRGYVMLMLMRAYQGLQDQ